MVELATVPNEWRCMWSEETHVLPVQGCCPVSGNPRPGSEISIHYEPIDRILEVAALRSYVDSYVGGRDSVRSMEGMIQAIAQDAADALGTYTNVYADLVIDPGQRMKLKCTAFPKTKGNEING